MKKYPDCAAAESLESELALPDGGADVPFLDKYISLLYPEKQCLCGYFPELPFFVTEEDGNIEDRLRSLDVIESENITSMLEARSVEPQYAVYTKYSGDF